VASALGAVGVRAAGSRVRCRVVVAIVIGVALGSNGEPAYAAASPLELRVGRPAGGQAAPGARRDPIGFAAAAGSKRRSAAIVGLAVVGALVGAFSAITFGPQIGAGVGITIGYLTWIALMANDVARRGIDLEGMKDRFYPTQTIETGKETLEWLQKRMPPGIGS
jgi:hypothetical protein